MTSGDQSNINDFRMDPNNLYREDAYTDLQIGSVRRFTPVKPDGSDDESRETLFFGQTQLMSPNGPLPIQCAIQAKNIDEAVKNFPYAVSGAVEEIIAEIKAKQEEESSRIIMPR